MAEKTKNSLRTAYDNAREFYNSIVTVWKNEVMTNLEYQVFMKRYSYMPDGEVPKKYHDWFKDLENRIQRHARLVRESKSGYTTINQSAQ